MRGACSKRAPLPVFTSSEGSAGSPESREPGRLDRRSTRGRHGRRSKRGRHDRCAEQGINDPHAEKCTTFEELDGTGAPRAPTRPVVAAEPGGTGSGPTERCAAALAATQDSPWPMELEAAVFTPPCGKWIDQGGALKKLETLAEPGTASAANSAIGRLSRRTQGWSAPRGSLAPARSHLGHSGHKHFPPLLRCRPESASPRGPSPFLCGTQKIKRQCSKGSLRQAYPNSDV